MTRRPPTLDVPAATASLAAVRRFVERHALAAGLPEASVEAITLAVDEASANVIKHAYGGDPDRHFEVVVRAEPDRFTVRIRHTGRAFDPERYRGPLALAEAAKLRRNGGFGVFLMQRLVDEVAFLTRAGVSEVRLVKHRPVAAPAATA